LIKPSIKSVDFIELKKLRQPRYTLKKKKNSVDKMPILLHKFPRNQFLPANVITLAWLYSFWCLIYIHRWLWAII